MNKVLVLVKPDGVERGLVGEIVARFERMGFKILDMKMMTLTSELLKEHYAHLAQKPFFPEIEAYMSRGPVVALIVEGLNAVVKVRNLVGATNPTESAMGTIRGDFALDIGGNLIHASDSDENAEIEIKRFFG